MGEEVLGCALLGLFVLCLVGLAIRVLIYAVERAIILWVVHWPWLALGAVVVAGLWLCWQCLVRWFKRWRIKQQTERATAQIRQIYRDTLRQMDGFRTRQR